MKTTSVSSAAISNAMRYQQGRMQADLVKAQKEMNSGRVADVGLALGTRTAQSVTFQRDMDRLNGIADSNALISSRLSSTQDALGQLVDTAQTLLSALPSAVSGDMASDVTRDSGKAALQAMTSILNTSANGEYLFAGTNTDVKPIGDFGAGSPAKAALDAAFLAHFGFAQDDPAAANITAADMDDFITNDVTPQFMGAGWQANWSSATDQQIVSRIALNETTETSVSANNDGVRKLAMAAAIVNDLFSSSTMSADARKTVASRAFSLVGEAVSDLGQTQSQTGIIQNRVSQATDRIKTQADLFEKHISDLQGVDPYEAANRVNDLMSHIQTSFALTARIQQLSLLNFLT